MCPVDQRSKQRGAESHAVERVPPWNVLCALSREAFAGARSASSVLLLKR